MVVSLDDIAALCWCGRGQGQDYVGLAIAMLVWDIDGHDKLG